MLIARHLLTARRPLAQAAGHQLRRLSSSSSSSSLVSATTNSKPTYITTPIFYVNAKPHIGHLHSVVLADTLRRYALLRKGIADTNHSSSNSERVFLSVGTDEHGLKIQNAAKAANMPPQQFCDQITVAFKELFDRANIGYSDYLRTTQPRHHKAAQELWRRLEAQGYIYKGGHEGWYSVSDEAFYPSTHVKDVEGGDGKLQKVSMETGSAVEWVREENYMFRLSKLQDRLREWLKSGTGNDAVVCPPNRLNETLGWLSGPVEDISISRPHSRVQWGIPVPSDPAHTMYVWIEALSVYLTATGFPWSPSASSSPPTPSQNLFPPTVQIVGKDILRFHAVFWPAFLMAADLPLPRRIMAHAHWTMGMQKISKSRGNVVNPFDIMDQYGVDTVRYYLMRESSLADDSNFTVEMIERHYKKDLQSLWGNLVSRCTSPSFKGYIADALSNSQQRIERVMEATPALDGWLTLEENCAHHFESGEIGRAIALVRERLTAANLYVSTVEPWSLAKRLKADPESSNSQSLKQQIEDALFIGLETARQAAIILHPIMPTKTSQILDALAIPTGERSWDFARVGRGWQSDDLNQVATQLAGKKMKPLFPELDITNK
ncbi:hypothetical protein GQ42DRAFT_163149 [Ramicandelaber brevisporus]|nr:hypothetical protein GQ42DRAFT_163149 [Ramicandelaber brevisporus]